MTNINEIFSQAIKYNASDVLITVGVPVAFRINGEYTFLNNETVTCDTSRTLATEILGNEINELLIRKEIEKSLSALGYTFRVSVFLQKGMCAVSARVLSGKILTFSELGLPQCIENILQMQRGLILVTGATGNGKSTTMASMVDYINSTRRCHIVTIEDPIEFTHNHKKSIISQKQVGRDTDSFAGALRSVLREDPDVIVIGEMRDAETISTALTCAETGHLVISTLHTLNAASTVDRIIDMFGGDKQEQIRLQFSMLIEAIITQRLVPRKNGGRALVYELATFPPAMRNLIRNNKVHLMPGQIEISQAHGMVTFEKSEQMLRSKGII